jgi:DNA polymerase-3 subunit delta'
LNLNSANAILKSLEEPPVRTVFLILSNAPGRLLPTVRSRCRVLHLAPLGKDDLRWAVADACATVGRPAPDAEEMPALARLGRGSVRRVLQLMEGNALAIAEALTGLLTSLPALDRPGVHKLAAMTGSRETEDYTVAFDLLEEMLAEAIRAVSLDEPPRRFPQLRSLVKQITPDSLADWAELWETIRQARGEAERLNLDKAALLITVFEKIDQTARAAAKRAT